MSNKIGRFFQIFVAFSEFMNFMQIFTLILVCLMKNWYEFCRYKTCYAALQVQICQPKSLFVQHASLMYIVQILLGAFWRACLFVVFICAKKFRNSAELNLKFRSIIDSDTSLSCFIEQVGNLKIFKSPEYASSIYPPHAFYFTLKEYLEK